MDSINSIEDVVLHTQIRERVENLEGWQSYYNHHPVTLLASHNRAAHLKLETVRRLHGHRVLV